MSQFLLMLGFGSCVKTLQIGIFFYILCFAGITKKAIIYTLFGINAPEGANKTLITVRYHTHLFSAAPYYFGQGKLGSLCGEPTSTSSMGSDRDSNPLPFGCKARTLAATTTPSCRERCLTTKDF